MASNFYIFNKFARPLVQINADSTPRGWVLNDVERCDFEMPILDPKFTEVNMQFGNLVRIEHIPKPGRGKLPDWVGIILPRQAWNKGVANMAAYSAEAILIRRPMPWLRVEGTPRTIFLKILKYVAEVDRNIPILPGVVEDANIQLTDDLRGSAYEHIVTLIKRSGMSWSITGSVAPNGQLVLYANLTATTGLDTGLQMNNLNSRLHSPIMVVDGHPSNVVNGFSYASTARARYERQGINQDALADYGYMGVNKTFTGIHDPSSTRTAAQIEANTFGRPIRKMNRTALDFEKTFDYLNRGNLIEIDEPEVGFKPGGGIGTKGKARIISMSYNDRTDDVVLNTEVL